MTVRGPSRRDVLRAFGVAAAAPLACGDNLRGRGTIAIVGGGLAGLTAASMLVHAGAPVDVYEAAPRVGGRIYTARDVNSYGHNVDLGGEHIDTSHVVMQALAASYGLVVDDLRDINQVLPYEAITFFDGRIVPAFEVQPELDTLHAKLLAARYANDAARIDQLSVPAWLDEAGLAPTSLLRRIIEVAYTQELGLEASEQTAWNLIAGVDALDPYGLAIWGEHDRALHLHEGSAALTDALAARFTDRIHLQHRLVRVEASGGRYTLAFATPGGEVLVQAEHVVYALPFSTLRDVDLSRAGLSEAKHRAIAEVGYGTHSKLAMQYEERYWRGRLWDGTVLTDVGKLQGLWDASRLQGVDFGSTSTEYGILMNCVGGARGIDIGSGAVRDQADIIRLWIQKVLAAPGSDKYIPGTALRMVWPSHPFSKGSRACYRVGQWTTLRGVEGAREGNQLFCGEHCSLDFQGTMEGAARTGLVVAAELLDELGADRPLALTALLPLV